MYLDYTHGLCIYNLNRVQVINNIHSDYYYICTTDIIQAFQAFYVHGHELQFTTIHGAFPLLLLPLASSPFPPFVSPSTYLEPS
jgi:hypothetical protein